MIRVAVSGAAGRMGSTVCKAVEGAEDMELVARADPGLDLSLAEALAREPDVLVDFSIPSTAVENIKTAVGAGVHVVVGTTGFELADVTGKYVLHDYANGDREWLRARPREGRGPRAAS